MIDKIGVFLNERFSGASNTVAMLQEVHTNKGVNPVGWDISCNVDQLQQLDQLGSSWSSDSHFGSMHRCPGEYCSVSKDYGLGLLSSADLLDARDVSLSDACSIPQSSDCRDSNEVHPCDTWGSQGDTQDRIVLVSRLDGVRAGSSDIWIVNTHLFGKGNWSELERAQLIECQAETIVEAIDNPTNGGQAPLANDVVILTGDFNTRLWDDRKLDSDPAEGLSVKAASDAPAWANLHRVLANAGFHRVSVGGNTASNGLDPPSRAIDHFFVRDRLGVLTKTRAEVHCPEAIAGDLRGFLSDHCAISLDLEWGGSKTSAKLLPVLPLIF